MKQTMPILHRLHQFISTTCTLDHLGTLLSHLTVTAIILISIDVALVAVWFPTGLSSTTGFATFLLLEFQILFCHLLLALPLLPITNKLIGKMAVRLCPATLLTGLLVTTGTITVSKKVIDFTSIAQYRSFPEPVNLIMILGLVLTLAIFLLIGRVILWPAFSRLGLAKIPQAPAQRLLGLILIIGTGMSIAWAAALFFQINAVGLTVPFLLGAAILIPGGLHLLTNFRPTNKYLRFATLLFPLISTILGIVLGWSNPHARYVLYNHAPLAISLTNQTQRLLDQDNDGIAAVLFGGTDCNDADALVNPTEFDFPGDGIDQDCSGKDSDRTLHPTGPVSFLSTCALPTEKPNILLISIDALRMDHVRPDLMPALFHFANSTNAFINAYAPAGYTDYSFLSLFTGRPVTGMTDINPLTNDRYCAPPTITERFQAAGYQTAFFSFVGKAKGTVRGFSESNQFPIVTDLFSVPILAENGPLTSAIIANATIQFVESRKHEPFFLWSHFVDTHAPYNVPTADDHHMDNLTPYEKGCAYVDYHVSRVLAALSKSTLRNNTIIIILADHGEELQQRGRLGHGSTVFDENIRVPLFIHVPNCVPAIHPEPVLTSQINSWLNQLVSPVVRRAQTTKTDAQLPIVSEALSREPGNAFLLRAIVLDNYKLIVDVKNGGEMLFNLKADPAELVNIAGLEPDRLKQLKSAYHQWLAQVAATPIRPCTVGRDGDSVSRTVFGHH